MCIIYKCLFLVKDIIIIFYLRFHFMTLIALIHYITNSAIVLYVRAVNEKKIVLISLYTSVIIIY